MFSFLPAIISLGLALVGRRKGAAFKSVAACFVWLYLQADIFMLVSSSNKYNYSPNRNGQRNRIKYMEPK